MKNTFVRRRLYDTNGLHEEEDTKQKWHENEEKLMMHLNV
jgi:hypothetical protein